MTHPIVYSDVKTEAPHSDMPPWCQGKDISEGFTFLYLGKEWQIFHDFLLPRLIPLNKKWHLKEKNIKIGDNVGSFTCIFGVVSFLIFPSSVQNITPSYQLYVGS